MQNKLQNIEKEAAAKAALDFIKPGMLVGLGSGTTASLFIQELGRLCQNGLSIKAVASSLHSSQLAQTVGVPLADIQTLSQLDITVDGADEADRKKNLIKGGGGALLREKIVAKMSKEMIVIVDSSKIVDSLGHFPLPVEILPFAYQATLHHLQTLGYHGKLRTQPTGNLYLTDSHNYILDIQLAYPCQDPPIENQRIRSIPGVIETGFFLGIASKVIVGHSDGTTTTF